MDRCFNLEISFGEIRFWELNRKVWKGMVYTQYDPSAIYLGSRNFLLFCLVPFVHLQMGEFRLSAWICQTFPSCKLA